MSFVTIEPHNSVFVKVVFSDRNSSVAFKETVTEVLQNYDLLKKNPANYRRWKHWDGKISYYDLNTRLMSYGLISNLTKFCTTHNINVIDNVTINETHTDKYLDNLNINDYDKVNEVFYEIKPDKFQRQAFIKALNHKFFRLQLATGGGKSLFSYCLIHYLRKKVEGKIVVVVNKQNLANQMYDEYGYYSKFDNNFDMSDISVIHSKSKHNIDNKILFIVHNTMVKKDKEFFDSIDVLIVDEAHTAENKSLKSIIEKCVNVKYRIGMSGTFEQKDVLATDLCLQAYLGDNHHIASQRDLIENNRASDFEGRFYILKHTDYDRELFKKLKRDKDYIRKKEYNVLDNIKKKNIQDILEKIKNINTGKCHGDLAYLNDRLDFLQNTYIQTKSKKWGYMDEVEFLISCEARNRFVINTALNNTVGNSLITFSRIEKHGIILHQMVLEEVKKRNLDVEVFLIHGKSELDPNEAREIIEKCPKRCIILANIQMVTMGWSVKNLHFCYMACSVKNPRALIQLAGRLLRKDGTDIKTALFSILDDIPIEGKNTYSYQHGLVNMQTIINENHNVKQKTVDLNQYFKKD